MPICQQIFKIGLCRLTAKAKPTIQLVSKVFAYDKRKFKDNDALNLEILEFIHSVKTGKRPLVDGEASKRALETAIKITSLITQKPYPPAKKR